MKNKGLITVIFLTLTWGAIGLFAFYQNSQRELSQVAIEFSKTPVFLRDSLVNKLLIQNLEDQKKERILEVDLNMIESVIEQNPYVQKAEIYPLSPRDLALRLEERTPIFRVFGPKNYYVDAELIPFPAMASRSVAVPVVYGDPSPSQLAQAYAILRKVNSFPRLEGRLTSISLKEEASFQLEFRDLPFQVMLGRATSVGEKCKKILLFEDFQQQVKDSIQYKQIHLDYAHQIVAIPVRS